jgi:phosphomannomutase
VSDLEAALTAVESAYAEVPGATLDHLDGLTVTTDDWWFNVRPSNTEPLLRLNVEGADDPTMTRIRDEVLSIIRKDAS